MGEEADLIEHITQTRAWCEEMGVIALEEIQEVVGDLEQHLALKFAEKSRLRRALAGAADIVASVEKAEQLREEQAREQQRHDRAESRRRQKEKERQDIEREVLQTEHEAEDATKKAKMAELEYLSTVMSEMEKDLLEKKRQEQTQNMQELREKAHMVDVILREKDKI